MQTRQKGFSIDSIFSFLLLLIFCLFTLMLSGTGSTIYRNGTAYLNENYSSRTAAAYVAEKVRQHDEAGTVFLTSIDAPAANELSGEETSSDEDRSVSEKISALAFRDTIEDADFITYVYFYDNALRELMIPEERTPDAAMGSRIVELSSLTIEAVAGTDLLSVTAVGAQGNALSELIHVSGGVGSPE